MINFKEYLKSNRVYFDGGFGTSLQSMGLKMGETSESWNLTNPQKITSLHKQYIDAGCNVITVNSFGINSDKYANYDEMIKSAVECAKNAVKGTDTLIAFDIGPTGRMLEPLGDLSFENAVNIFANSVKSAVKYGVDLFIIETFNDCYETKSALLAVKENSNLPVIVSNAYDKSGKLMTGASPLAMVSMLEGLGADAIGINCSFGPDLMLDIVDEYIKYSSLPIIVMPNAGLPKIIDGKTTFTVDEEEFSNYMQIIAKKGVSILGGCCGTTPSYIKKTIEKTKDLPYFYPCKKEFTAVSSYTNAVLIEGKPIIIGERINPTGKSKVKECLKSGNYAYLLNEAVMQVEKGAKILDVNAGLFEIDEALTIKNLVSEIQSVTDVPLQIDSSNAKALESAMRIYNGKPLVNSVNGKKESMDAVFPLIKKYGGVVIALTMDENGIPQTAKERYEIALNILQYAKKFGITKQDIVFDPLCMAISADNGGAITTLETLKLLNGGGFKTCLGVSNVSFGLPLRNKINATFFSLAMSKGLNLAIINPFSSEMLDAFYAFNAISKNDVNLQNYIGYATSQQEVKPTQTVSSTTLEKAIVLGLKEEAKNIVNSLILTEEPLDIINRKIIPALKEVGDGFESKKLYLPQLLMSAETATLALDIVKQKIPKTDSGNSQNAVILATVKGDIHDIGKNIVKVLLESYGFKVYDLGRDVPPNKVVDFAIQTNCKLVGLSALMTTTVPSMQETITALRDKINDITVIVGGAVLSKETAKNVGADAYCRDALQTVKFTQEYYKK